MRKCELSEAYQTKFLGDNARRLYNIKPPHTFIRERIAEIPRPDWWPTDEEVKQALEPEAAIVRSYGEGAQRVNGRAMEGERV
jgi:hypothetical protein